MLTYEEDKRLAVLKLAVDYDSRLKAACIIAKRDYEPQVWDNIKLFTNYIETGKIPDGN